MSEPAGLVRVRAAVRNRHRPNPAFKIRTLLTGAALLGIFACGPRAVAATRWETLFAIHMVENPNDSRAPGPKGELGAYQFRADTWKMHSKLHFTYALDREKSDEVAVKHYEWLKASLQRNGFEATPFNIALAWNAGVSRVVAGNASRQSRDYAARVSNIAEALHERLARERNLLASGN